MSRDEDVTKKSGGREGERERESELETHSDTVDKRDSLSRFTQSCVFGV